MKACQLIAALSFFWSQQAVFQVSGMSFYIPNLSKLRPAHQKHWLHHRPSKRPQTHARVQPRSSSEIQILEEFLFSPSVNKFIKAQTCGMNMTNMPIGSFAFLTSPNYPKDYPPNLDCYWFLQGQQGSVVKVIIFDLILQGWFNRFWDYFMVSVNSAGGSTTYKRYAGDYTIMTPFTVSAKTNIAQIVFHTSALFNFNGFKMAYLVTSADPPSTTPPVLGNWETCGIPAVQDWRIVGGKEARPHSYPWMAFLIIDDDAACGGVLISNQFIITAAHCTDQALFIIVMLGLHDLSDGSEYLNGRVAFNSTMWYQHPQYDSVNLFNDISIVKLPRPVQFSDKIRPICLPSRWHLPQTYEDAKVTASGWGFTRDDTSVNRYLKSLNMQILPHSVCTDVFPVRVTGSTLCGGGVVNQSTCQGDSGGPIQFQQSNGAFVLVGSVSYGGPSCQEGTPIVFTRTTAYLDFISMVTGITVV